MQISYYMSLEVDEYWWVQPISLQYLHQYHRQGHLCMTSNALLRHHLRDGWMVGGHYCLYRPPASSNVSTITPSTHHALDFLVSVPTSKHRIQQDTKGQSAAQADQSRRSSTSHWGSPDIQSTMWHKGHFWHQSQRQSNSLSRTIVALANGSARLPHV